MVPFGLSTEQFSKRFLSSLEKASPKFIEEMKSLFLLPVPDAVCEAEVQIFLGDDGMETPSAWLYFRGKNNKVDSSDPTIFPGKSSEILEGTYDVPSFDEEYYFNEDFGGVNLIADITKRWLAECWWKAGGWEYPIPVKVWVHDDFGDGLPIVLTKFC
ncbi:hypothetical protein [Enterovibrio norvegicus]|uniref:Uncharacterized protein n=1 Tax=Enterovibrio norvegicus TaxID=188144 RepID=A0A2N7L368_9GAMM|nr:hypothetical protein [Enterovibrio norvegicus]PMN87342.1 hypothetical protein BCT23_08260 [Enterovibrio norvegicus]